MRGHLVLLALGLATACTDPTVEVQLVFSGDGPGSLAEAVTRYDLAVVVIAGADCDDPRYLELSAEDLARGTREFIRDQPLSSPATLANVPRVDPKLFVVTGYDQRGTVIAGGCADVREAIEADRPVPILMEPALITRVIDSDAVTPSLTLPETDGFELLARERRRDGAPVAQAALRFVLRTSVGDLPLATTRDTPSIQITPVAGTDSVFTVSGLAGLTLDQLPGDTQPAGPAELVIRGAWSDEVNRIPVSIAVPSTRATLDDGPVRNQIAAAWTTLPCLASTSGPCVRAAALVQGAAGDPHLVTFTIMWADGAPIPSIARTVGPELPGARTLVAFERPADGALRLVTRTATGWTTLQLTGEDWRATPGTEVTAAADQLLAFPPCGSDATIGLLAITGGRASGYERPLPLVDPTARIGWLAAVIQGWLDQGETIELLGAACLRTRHSGGEAVFVPGLAVRRTTAAMATITLLLSDGSEAKVVDTDLVGAVTAAMVGEAPAIIAASPEHNALQVLSSRLIYDGAGLRMVPDGLIAHPVPAVPKALTALDANVDGVEDTLALVPVGADLGLAMTIGRGRADDALSATLRLDLPAPVQRLVPLGQPGQRQRLVVLDDEGVVVFDFAPPRPR